MRNKIIILLISVFSFISFETFSQTSWEIDKNKDGIKIYARTEIGSDYKSFKAIIRVNASIDKIITILKDVNSYKKWFAYTKTSKILKHENGIQYNYVETILPWPYGNRDMVYRMSIDKFGAGSVKISLKGIPDYIPNKKGITRMKKAEGYILLKSLGYGTEVIYIFHSEPGGNLPTWLANKSIAELPFKTLSGLREILKEEND